MGIGADGPGLYNYTRGSPVTLSDPSGHQSKSDDCGAESGCGQGTANPPERTELERQDFQSAQKWARARDFFAKTRDQIEEGLQVPVWSRVTTDDGGYAYLFNDSGLRAAGFSQDILDWFQQGLRDYGLKPENSEPIGDWIGEQAPGIPIRGWGTLTQANERAEAGRSEALQEAVGGLAYSVAGIGAGSAQFRDVANAFNPVYPTTTITDESGATATVGGGGGGGATAPAAVAGADPSGLSPPVSYNYRGVHAGHPAMAEALQGKVVPGNIHGKTTVQMHNADIGLADSPYTAWTPKLDYAREMAQRMGAGGIVLRVPLGPPPPGATWHWEASDDEFGESEVFLHGIRFNVEVFERW